MNTSLFDALREGLTLGTVSRLVMLLLFIMLIYATYTYCAVDYISMARKFFNKTIRFLGGRINLAEERYHRNVMIGKFNSKSKKVKHYRFLNDLIIDLELKPRGCTPYEFLWTLIIGSVLVATLAATLIFNNTLLILPISIIAFIGITCGLYTKANLAHDRRIEAVLESENVICNNIKDGVVVAARNAINLMPLEVRDVYRDFIDDVESKNYHIKDALMELNNNLGSIADDFIKKCIVLETEEEKGIAGMFQDIVEINNIKSEIRTDMKRKFEKVAREFMLSVGAIMILMGGEIALYEILFNFYIKNGIGQIILLLDVLVLILEFVYITKQRATAL